MNAIPSTPPHNTEDDDPQESHAPRLSREEAREVASRLFGIEAEVSSLPSYDDQNFRIDHTDGSGISRRHVLKISNGGEDQEALDLQNRVMEHLARADLPYATSQVRPTLEGQLTSAWTTATGQQHMVRLLTWVGGTPWALGPHPDTDAHRALGRLCAQLVDALEDFEHPAMDRFMSWDPKHTLEARGDLGEIPDRHRRKLAEGIFDRFEHRVLPRLDGLPTQVLHTDINNYNLLVETRGADDGAEIVGLIDFGDVVRTPTVGEVAVAIAYAMLDQDDPLQVAQDAVAGYDEVRSLDEIERSLVIDLALARLAKSVTSSAHQRRVAPDNTYALVCEAPAWRVIEALSHHPEAKLG